MSETRKSQFLPHLICKLKKESVTVITTVARCMLQNTIMVSLQDNGITFKALCHKVSSIKVSVCFICGNHYLTSETTLEYCQTPCGSTHDKAALSLWITSSVAAGRAPSKPVSTN